MPDRPTTPRPAHPGHAEPFPDVASLDRERRAIDAMMDEPSDPATPTLSPFAAEIAAGLAGFRDALRDGTAGELGRKDDLVL